MMTLSIGEIHAAVQGELIADQGAEKRRVRGLVWDSRKLIPGNVFLAMPGERVDGNDFIARAIQKQAGCIICTRDIDDNTRAIAGEFSCPLIKVDDGVAALTALARAWRQHLNAHVVGVTGSTGKTSTKDFLRAVFSQRFKTVATQGNQNNEVGVPATILAADEDTEVLIVEMGMRGIGQIERLVDFVRPDMAVITNIGVSHLELLGTQDNIARAKSEIFRGLPDGGTAVLNVDDPFMPKLIEYGQLDEHQLVKRCTYGTSAAADVRAAGIAFDLSACAEFELQLPDEEPVQVKLAMPGRHNVSNALAAAAAGFALGMQADQIAAGLEAARGSGMRMEVERSRRGITFVNDAYNANPDSMRSSLGTLSHMDCTGRRVAVLGDMGELGENELAMHREVGASAARSRLDLLVCVGNLARGIAAGAAASGMDADKIKCFDTVEDAIEFLRRTLAEGDLVLVKASRFMGMERIVKEIVE